MIQASLVSSPVSLQARGWFTRGLSVRAPQPGLPPFAAPHASPTCCQDWVSHMGQAMPRAGESDLEEFLGIGRCPGVGGNPWGPGSSCFSWGELFRETSRWGATWVRRGLQSRRC